jgi:DNA-binding transcriptional regulator YiaG
MSTNVKRAPDSVKLVAVNWERGLGAPDDIARVNLRVIERNPEAVAAALDE